jgi:beta-galactosidase
MVDVWCQSNCDSVELFLNGVSLGMQLMRRNSHLEWKVPFEPGVLEARGMRRGREVSARLETAGPGAAVVLEPDRGMIDGDGEDCSVVTVAMRDARGVELPTADRLVWFSLSGPGEIIGVGNGDPSSHEPDKWLDGRWRRRLFSGKCQVIIRSTGGSGTIRLTAAVDSCAAGEVSITATPAPRRPQVE